MIKETSLVIALVWALGGTIQCQHVYGSLYNPYKLPKPYHKPNQAKVIFAETVPVVDGQYDEMWHRVHIYPLQLLTGGRPNWDKDLIAGFQMVWGEENLYLMIQVIDDHPFPRDSVTDRVWLSIKPNTMRSSFLISIGKEDSFSAPAELSVIQCAWGPAPPPGHPTWETNVGYTIELSIPLSTIGLSGKADETFGLNVRVFDSDDGQVIEQNRTWANGIIAGGTDQMALGTAILVRHFNAGSEANYLPQQIWIEKDGVVIIEAEEIDRHSNWVFKEAPGGFTGRGYLEWQGPHRGIPPKPFIRSSNNDYSDERQGPQNEWLIIRVAITNPGLYVIDVRNLHQKVDGDNDVWFGRIGQSFGLEEPIQRMGDNLKDGSGFSWLDWGVRELELETGLHNFFIGGRSVGFGVDRIIIYQRDDPQSPVIARNLQQVPSRIQE